MAQDARRAQPAARLSGVVAPGTPLRDGFERILRGRTGALVVLGHGHDDADLCTGGFALDVPFTPTALRELAKMDGAIVLDWQAPTRIVRAGVQLMPDATHRHRRDRHPAPDGRPGGPAVRPTGGLDLRLDGHHRALPGRVPPVWSSTPTRSSPGPTRRCRLWSAIDRLGEVDHPAVVARGRGPGHRQGLRRGRAAAGDGASARPGAVRVRGRAGDRRPAAGPADARAGRRARPSCGGLLEKDYRPGDLAAE